MFKILLAITTFIISIYELQFTDAGGNTVDMNSFREKKILLVNIASGSNRINQLSGLQQLQEQYADSLVVIAFPSNSFGHEARNNTEILQLCQSYGVTFPVAQVNPVAGAGIQPIYQWLSDSTQNGEMNGVISGDFHKILINSQGEIIAVFAPALEPMDMLIRNAITGTN
ncbi:MAG: glutathione peroxidase [Sphingobacteriales bacterium]|nr:MAG: glutathione peroxidase [Sphingobacteriales bacterium]